VKLDEGVTRHMRRHWAVFGGLAAALAIWCAVDVGRRAAVDPQRPYLHMTDFTVYTEAGAAFFDGREPYEVSNVRGWRYLYLPLFALLVAPLAGLSPPAQASIFFAVSVLLCLGSYGECRKLLAAVLDEGPRHNRFVAVLSAVAAAGVLFPALNCLQRGQLGVALVYPLLAGFRLAVCGEARSARFLGGLVLALPVVLKLTPVLPVGCLLLALVVRDCRHLIVPRATTGLVGVGRGDSLAVGAGVLAGGVLFLLLIPASLIGWQANLRHLDTWYTRIGTKADHDRTDTFAGSGSTIRNQSLTNAVQRCGNWVAYQCAGGPDDRLLDQIHVPEMGSMPMDRPVVHTALLAVRGAAGLLLLAAAVALGLAGDRLSLGFILGLGCVASLVFSPVARGHYFVLFLPAVLFGGLWMRGRWNEKAALWFAAIPMLLCLTHYLALCYAGRIGLLGIGTALWFLCVCVCVAADALRGTRADQAEEEPVTCGTRETKGRAAA
jgi:hypothetical protein